MVIIDITFILNAVAFADIEAMILINPNVTCYILF